MNGVGIGGVNRNLGGGVAAIGGVNRTFKDGYATIGGANRKIFEDKNYLYNEGDEHTSITGGWAAGFVNLSATFVKNATNMTVTVPYSPSTAYGSAETNNTVNLVGYTKLKLQVNVTQNNSALLMAIHTTRGVYPYTVRYPEEPYKLPLGINTYEWNISAYPGSYYIKVYGQSANGVGTGTIAFEIQKIWLE